jgi:hypothetical protein
MEDSGGVIVRGLDCLDCFGLGVLIWGRGMGVNE